MLPELGVKVDGRDGTKSNILGVVKMEEPRMTEAPRGRAEALLPESGRAGQVGDADPKGRAPFMDDLRKQWSSANGIAGA